MTSSTFTKRAIQSTGIVYHEDMTIGLHSCLWDPNYPECPERCEKILERCTALNLIERCHRIPTRLASGDEIERLHSKELITLLKSCETNKDLDELEDISSRYDSIYISSDTNRIALLSAGSALNLIKAVCTDEVKNGMAIIRPPGHHAMTSAFCGYCFFNNVALAANYALETFNMNRILIVDWDVHHGQATQQMFYNDPRVLYFSIHRFQHGAFWPNLRESNSDYVGEGAGEGFNFNVPLNKTGLGNADYLTIFHQILLPLTIEYQPELIIVSAGYDAALGCFEGEMLVTPACYAHLINSLSNFANGRLAVVLEGGYFLDSLAEGAALTLRALLGDQCPDIGPVGPIDESTRETILNVIYTHRKYWNCFQIHGKFEETQTQSSITNSDYFVPCIKFEHTEEVLEKFPTRTCYPSRCEEEIKYYKAKIDELIQETELIDTQYRCLPYSSPSSKNYEQILSIFQEENILKITENEEILSIVLNAIMKNLARSVVLDKTSMEMKSNGFIESIIINRLMTQFSFKRILLVDMHTQNKLTEVQYQNNILIFSFNQDTEDIQTVDRNFFINFKSPENLVSDVDYITSWLKILLPISYQYNPEIIIISIDFHKGPNILPTTYAYLIHWLTSLANGKIIFVANYDSEKESERMSFSCCCEALLGNSISSMERSSTVISEETVNTLKILTEDIEQEWCNLNFVVKFPDKCVQ